MDNFGKNLNLKRRGDSKGLTNSKKTFTNLINTFEQLHLRTYSIEEQAGIILERYEEPFFALIEGLFYMNYGDWQAELIMWYVYDRLDEDDNILPLIITDENNETEEEVYITTPGELYDLIKKIGKKSK